MHFTAILALSPLLFSLVVADGHAHRRHHVKRSTCHTKTKSTSASTSASPESAINAVGLNAKLGVSVTVSTSSSTSSSSSDTFGLASLPKLPSGIHFGWLPADGSSTGAAETIQTVLSSVGQTTSAQGYYAQATDGVTFTGSQLTSRKASIVAAGGIFQPAVMPISWWGLTNSDNQQAVAICTVMKEFTDAGIETWLRFAHEANWYQTDGTYQGGASDFLEGWVVVAKACKTIAPKVKMYWTPNVASAASYASYWPGADYVDVVGVDWYPSTTGSFISELQEFHDTYTSDTIIMAQGETALAVSSGIAAQLVWMQEITSVAAAQAMPRYKSVSWFNYDKEENFKIANIDGDSATKAILAAAS